MTPALTPKEIAKLERLSPDAIYRAIASGDLAARKVCGRLRVDPADYEAWKDRHRVPPRPESPMLMPRVRSADSVGSGSFLAELQAVEKRRGHGA